MDNHCQRITAPVSGDFTIIEEDWLTLKDNSYNENGCITVNCGVYPTNEENGTTDNDETTMNDKNERREKFKRILFILALVQLVLSLLTAVFGSATLALAHDWYLTPINADGAGLWAGLLGVAAGALALYFSRNITCQPVEIVHLVVFSLHIIASFALGICFATSVYWALDLYGHEENILRSTSVVPYQRSPVPNVSLLQDNKRDNADIHGIENEDEIIRRVLVADIALNIVTAVLAIVSCIICLVSACFMCCGESGVLKATERFNGRTKISCKTEGKQKKHHRDTPDAVPEGESML